MQRKRNDLILMTITIVINSLRPLTFSLHFRGFSGTAGRTSSLTHSGTQFSTKDQDNDNCSCKCAQMASGGWWFDACGPSNLNGIYYGSGSNVVRYNGIKWYYWKGPSMVATVTTMMVRPVDFQRAPVVGVAGGWGGKKGGAGEGRSARAHKSLSCRITV
ncbi:hypothetical protein JZ751_000506 [Albula glossodonta]|uniref:Fibrinogen C-terminal domain-containing protein n=1 Tax=Albula glossodonta TaxID=121402 RepID=A0A8T2PWL4_9TELE|nr:hypothetical protein JZ751_000506 [Albula glossodonta]